jgi:hypothetical protein
MQGRLDTSLLRRQWLKIRGGEFLNEHKKKIFRDMLSKHGKAFASSPDEIGCVQPSMVLPMVIFTVSHIP